ARRPTAASRSPLFLVSQPVAARRGPAAFGVMSESNEVDQFARRYDILRRFVGCGLFANANRSRIAIFYRTKVLFWSVEGSAQLAAIPPRNIDVRLSMQVKSLMIAASFAFLGSAGFAAEQELFTADGEHAVAEAP